METEVGVMQPQQRNVRGNEKILPQASGGSMALPIPDFRILASRTLREFISVVLSHSVCGNWLQQS